jgi:phage FluMu gp28-like protein
MVVSAKSKLVIPKSGTVSIKLYTPHKAQRRLHDSKARFRVCCCGRRWGKTLAALNEMVKFAADHPGSTCAWIAPVYRQCKRVYRVLKRALRDVTTYHTDQELIIQIANGSQFVFYSATNEDTIRGDGFDFAVLDECADIAETVWTAVVMPLLNAGARVIFIGTPKGRNWFYRLFNRGLDPLDTEWDAMTFPTSSNPYRSKQDIENAKRDLPEDVFLQEYEAQFLEDSAGAFRKIDQCIIENAVSKEHPERFEEDFEDPIPFEPYVIGWDVARAQDFSVFSVLRITTMTLVAWARFNIVDYVEQVDRAKHISTLYNDASILMDATGVGDAVYSMARNEGLNVDPFVYTNTSKKDLWEELIGCIQNRGIRYPNIPVMIGELKTAQYKYTPVKRLITYEASPHDDCINSLALAKRAAGDGVGIPMAVTGQRTRGQERSEESLMYQERQYSDPELMKRQATISSVLDNVELLATFGND